MPQPPALPGNFVSSTTPNTPTPALHDDGNGSQQVPTEPGTPRRRPGAYQIRVCRTAAGSAIIPVTATVVVWAFDPTGPASA
jgi:hypothetical protein